MRLPPRFVLAVRVVFVAGILLGLYALSIETRWLTERACALELRGWSSACEGLRIDVAADLHTGSFGNGTGQIDTVVAKLVASDAGIVLLGRLRYLQGAVRRLCAG
ncbi:hypothetical protein EBB59_11545 [Lysobacter pythonis]|uniref:Metallophosphoesterase n=1 Tax=Solilutibacter pythonis TaxID=2483112 RepID=A0A3M2HFT9_9GAMM|nr:hypothetical protein [Lysobacter pythonis]RMH88601.1 hypothetical protein EBB59_11545 [Lysobacter pythonis]